MRDGQGNLDGSAILWCEGLRRDAFLYFSGIFHVSGLKFPVEAENGKANRPVTGCNGSKMAFWAEAVQVDVVRINRLQGQTEPFSGKVS